MKQSRLMSLIESTVNILVGFGISLGAQIVFLPLLGVSISFSQNFLFACIMTVISIARSFILRRLFEALHIRNPLSPGALAIVAERRRQIEAEGWTPDHDLDHRKGELALAGATYALYARHDRRHVCPPEWPWDREWWKQHSFRRDLVKAGALILAEIDRDDHARKTRRNIINAQPGDA